MISEHLQMASHFIFTFSQRSAETFILTEIMLLDAPRCCASICNISPPFRLPTAAYFRRLLFRPLRACSQIRRWFTHFADLSFCSEYRAEWCFPRVHSMIDDSRCPLSNVYFSRLSADIDNGRIRLRRPACKQWVAEKRGGIKVSTLFLHAWWYLLAGHASWWVSSICDSQHVKICYARRTLLAYARAFEADAKPPFAARNNDDSGAGDRMRCSAKRMARQRAWSIRSSH